MKSAFGLMKSATKLPDEAKSPLIHFSHFNSFISPAKAASFIPLAHCPNQRFGVGAPEPWRSQRYALLG